MENKEYLIVTNKNNASTRPQRSFLQELLDFIKTLVIAAFLAFFVIRGFIFEPYRIPSTSMVPTLKIGDFLFVGKWSYGSRFPFTDYFFNTIDPKRGDIAVFKMESNLPGSFFGFGSTMFIKRVMALPGDTIEYRDKQVLINGNPLPLEYAGDYTDYRGVLLRLYTETLTNGSTHLTAQNQFVPGIDVPPVTVPEDMFVMMGDNRDNSRDSRFWVEGTWGFVPRENLIGKAQLIFFSLDGFKPRLERIGTSLKPHMN